MNKTLLSLTAALLSSPALADTLIDHANGIQAGARGQLEHFTGLLVGWEYAFSKITESPRATRTTPAKPLSRCTRTIASSRAGD